MSQDEAAWLVIFLGPFYSIVAGAAVVAVVRAIIDRARHGRTGR